MSVILCECRQTTINVYTYYYSHKVGNNNYNTCTIIIVMNTVIYVEDFKQHHTLWKTQLEIFILNKEEERQKRWG